MSVGQPELLIEAEAAADAQLEAVGAGEIAARSPLQLFWRRFRGDRVATIAAAVIVFLILVAIFAPLIVKLVGSPGPYTPDPAAHDQFGDPTGPKTSGLWPFIIAIAGLALTMLVRSLRWRPMRRWGWIVVLGASLAAAVALAIAYWPHVPHLFGVDKEYRDVFARVLYGARVSLEVALIATGISMVIGVVLGMVAGFFRGWVDMLISRVIDVLLAFPILLLALGLAAACKLGKGCLGGLIQPGLTVVIAVIAFVNWTYIARIVRGQVLSLREKEFVEAARSLGASGRRILFREILPNLVAPIIVYSSLIIPQNVLFEAALSYLGVGVQFPKASWGAMLSDASSIFDTAWWYMVFPGAALLITVLAFNLLGDGLQDAMNPRAGRA
jgi:ABC-type dipeptide/oligopeptide/nickel transport system permease subunit